MKKIIIIFLFVFYFVSVISAGEYSGLTPGVSTRADTEKELGAPVERKGSLKCDFSPEGHDLKKLSVEFYDDSIVKSIHLLFNTPYAGAKIREWFGLKDGPDQVDEMMGRRVEFYKNQGIKIVFEDLHADSDIIQLSHVDVSRRGSKSAAKKSAAQGLNSCPAAAEKYAELADPFISQNQHAKAIAPLKKAAMCDPDRAVYARMLAFAYWQDNQWNEAIEWAKKTLGLQEDYIAYSVLGSAYWQKKDCDAALSYLEKAVSFGQDKGKDNLELLGACYYQKGLLNEALATLVKAYQRDRQSFLTLYYLAATSDRLGNKPDAKLYYKKFLKTKQGNQDMIFAAKERLSVLSREVEAPTRDKANQAAQTMIQTIFGQD